MKAIKPQEASPLYVGSSDPFEIIVGFLNAQIQRLVSIHGILSPGMTLREDIWPLKLSVCSNETTKKVIEEFENAGYKCECDKWFSFVCHDTYKITVI